MMQSEQEAGRAIVSELSTVLARSSLWMRIVALGAILGGAFGVLGILISLLSLLVPQISEAIEPTPWAVSIFAFFSLPISVVGLWSGVLLWQASNGVTLAQASGDGELFTTALDRLRLYFKIAALVMLASIGMALVTMAMGAGMAMVSSH